MRRLVFAAIAAAMLCGFGDTAAAQGCGPQNPNCVVPTAPFGTSNNQAASTAFVQGAVGSQALTSGNIWIGSAGNVATPQVPSGDCTLSIGGVLVCTKTNGVAFGTAANANVGTLARSILPNVNTGHVLPFLDTDVNWTSNSWNWVTDGTGFSGVLQGAAGTTITGTPTATETPGVTFTAAGLVGSPLTIRYTVVGGDTNNTIAAGLVTNIQANTAIKNAGIFAYYLGGNTINIQWNYATALTPTAANSANTTITIPGTNVAMDAVVLQLGRTWPGRTTLAGDTLTGFDWTGPNSGSAGALSTHWAQIVPYISNPAAGATGQGCINFNTGSSSAATGNNALARLNLCGGLALYDASQVIALNGDRGPGTINIPTTGGLFIGGAAIAQSGGLWAQGNVFGGTAVGSILNLQDTSNGAPAGSVQIKAAGNIGYSWNGSVATLSGTTTAAGLLRSTFGTPTIASGACGTTTNGTVSGTNQSGVVTIGAAATTTCTISFSATLSNAPGACLIFPGNAAAAATGTTVARAGAPSTSAWVITGSALANTVYSYICL